MKCLMTPDMTALEAHQTATQSSTTASSFFGCEVNAPYGNAAFATDHLSPTQDSRQVCEAPQTGSEPWWATEEQMCVDTGPQSCEMSEEELAALPPPTGLDAYTVVADDFVGPLGPNEIRQSQRDTLDQYDFGGFDVVGNDLVGPLGADQMRQSDYDELQSAWLNIADGKGMSMSGTPADQEAFLQMIRGSMGESAVMRDQMTTVGNDLDPTHNINFDLGRGQDITGAAGTGVWVDTFGTDQVDLDDLDFLPNTPGAAHTDELTRTELLAHFVSERRSAVTSANPNDFGPHHAQGLVVQNQVRDEFGQQHMTSQHGVANAAGGTDGVFTRADGSTQTVHTDAHNNMTGSTF